MPAVQARHAAPLLSATPAADIPGVDAACHEPWLESAGSGDGFARFQVSHDKRPPPDLLCESAAHRPGSAAPTGCRAQPPFQLKHPGRLVQHSLLPRRSADASARVVIAPAHLQSLSSFCTSPFILRVPACFGTTRSVRIENAYVPGREAERACSNVEANASEAE